MVKLIIAANWKMHKTGAEASAFCTRFRDVDKRMAGIDLLICPPYTALASARAALEGSAVKLGAQNLFWADKGAYTGEISPVMLIDQGVEYVIIGHSERRHIFGEDDDTIRKKIEAALTHGLKPILCIGETEAERASGETTAVLERQLESALEGFDDGGARNLVVAYEPVWAIGTGKAALPQDAESAAGFIRQTVKRLLGTAAAGLLRIQYGGSVSAANIADFTSLPDVNGALVGGASLEADSFIDLVEAAREAVGS